MHSVLQGQQDWPGSLGSDEQAEGLCGPNLHLELKKYSQEELISNSLGVLNKPNIFAISC